MPVENLIFVAGGRFDHFNQFGGIWTYRFAGSYKIDKTNTISFQRRDRFSPPSSQDKIFGNNLGWSRKRISVGTRASSKAALGKSGHGWPRPIFTTIYRT